MLHTFVALVSDRRGDLARVASAIVLVCSPMLLLGQSAKVHIRMVDGRNGKPWGKKHMEVYDATSDPRYLPKTLFEGTTDQYGVFDLDLDSSAVIGISGSTQCLSRRSTLKWRVADIVAKGAVQENSCNLRIVATPTPEEHD